MALETVAITVLDTELAQNPVDNVVVRVFDETGTTLITSGSTGTSDDGEVEFTLNGDADGIVYQLRFYISGGAIPSPQSIAVFSPPANAPTGANNFEITAELFTLPAALDSQLCRASGYVIGPDGRPRRGIDIHFIPFFRPAVVGGKAVLGERVAVRTDADGYVQVDLFRNADYYATVESHENVQREICLPDRSSVNIAHLLFPIVAAVEYDPTGPYTVAVGATLSIEPTVITSSFVELCDVADDDVEYSIDDVTIASVSVLSDRIEVRGLVPGVTSLRVTRRDTTILYAPDTDILGGVVAVTVIP